MKLKYQMRGLGIGMIITALLMGVTTREQIPLSDAEIRAKALTLGMIESDSLKLTDIQNTNYPSGGTPEPEDDITGSKGTEASSGETSGDAGDGTDGEVQGSDSAENDGTSGDADREPEGNGTVTVHIESGMSSYSASVVIAEAGLVEDATAFDRYLCNQGYSRKVADGTYEIPCDATEEEIAKIITKGR